MITEEMVNNNDIESVVSILGDITGNDLCRYMFIPNKLLDCYSLQKANLVQVGSAYAVSKDVSFTGEPYLRLIYPFVSVNKSDNEVRAAFQWAIDNNYKDVVISSRDIDYYKKVIPNFDESHLTLSNVYTDFYTDIKTRFVEHNENKFLKQHKIKMFANDIEFRPIHVEDFDAVKKLHNVWKESKGINVSRGFNKFLSDSFYETINLSNYLIYGLFFRGELFTFGVVNFHGKNNHIAYEEAQQSYNRHMLPEGFELNEETNKFVSNIGQIVYYYLFKYLESRGVDTIHCAGSSSANKTLLNYKMNLYKNKVDYYKYRF